MTNKCYSPQWTKFPELDQPITKSDKLTQFSKFEILRTPEFSFTAERGSK